MEEVLISEVITILKDEKGLIHLTISDDNMSYEEVIGILHMMIKRAERYIIEEEIKKHG